MLSRDTSVRSDNLIEIFFGVFYLCNKVEFRVYFLLLLAHFGQTVADDRVPLQRLLAFLPDPGQHFAGLLVQSLHVVALFQLGLPFRREPGEFDGGRVDFVVDLRGLIVRISVVKETNWK